MIPLQPRALADTVDGVLLLDPQVRGQALLRSALPNVFDSFRSTGPRSIPFLDGFGGKQGEGAKIDTVAGLAAIPDGMCLLRENASAGAIETAAAK